MLLLSPSSSHHDHFTFTFALTACSSSPSLLHKGREIHSSALKSGHLSDLFVQNSLLAFYSSARLTASSLTAFSDIPSPDVVSWTSIITALATNGHPREALRAFTSMDVPPNEITLVATLPACSRVRDVRSGKTLHGIRLRRFGGSNVVLDNALLGMYCNCGAFRDAVKVFDDMPQRDVVSGTTMICGYVRQGRHEEAVLLFMEMVGDGGMVGVNEVTVACVLRACANAGVLRLGKWVHSFAVRVFVEVDGVVGNALIHMYSSCGDVGMAVRVFEGMVYKDLVSWCSIIRGMATNGNLRSAMQLFSLMLCCGVRPDSVAFLAVLSGCCHGGFIEELLMFFRAMYGVYGIVPEKEHYTCLIDAFGRAGCLKEAEEFLMCMPMEHDKGVWGALLSACKMHGADDVVCKRIQERILDEGMVLGGGTYALLSNMLAKSEKWDESHNLRERINLRKIHKLAGYSWIGLA